MRLRGVYWRLGCLHVPELQLALEIPGGKAALNKAGCAKGAALDGGGPLIFGNEFQVGPIELIYLKRSSGTRMRS